MQTKHIDRYTLEGTGYGLTLFTDHYKGVRLVGHPGSITGYMSIFTLVPARRLGVIFLCNRNTREFPAFRIVDTILDEMLNLPAEVPPPIPVPSDRVVWPLYKGCYLGYQNGLATIDIAGGWLVLDMNGQVRQLKASSRDLYFAEPEQEGDEPLPVGFLLEEYNGTKQVNHIVIDGVPMNRIQFDPLFQLGEATLQRFAGTYRGPFTLACRVEDEQLVVRQVEKGVEAACVALDEWRLACQFGLLEFMAGDDGLVYRAQLAGTMAFDRVMGDENE
jgi:hypothetical protein